MCCTSPLAICALLQRHFVVVYDSVVRFWPPPTPLLSVATLRDCWFAVGALAPREGRFQQHGLLSVRIGLSFSHATSPSRARLKCLSLCLRAVSTLLVNVFVPASSLDVVAWFAVSCALRSATIAHLILALLSCILHAGVSTLQILRYVSSFL